MAFNDLVEELEWKLEQVPDDTDVLISHGPTLRILPRNELTSDVTA